MNNVEWIEILGALYSSFISIAKQTFSFVFV